MFSLKSAYTEQTATITKLLNEGWEPFQAIQVKTKDGKKIRMYFKRFLSEQVEAQPMQFELPQIDAAEAITQFSNVMTAWATKFLEDLDELMNTTEIKIQPQYDFRGYTVQKTELGVTAVPLTEEESRDPKRLRETFTKQELISFISELDDDFEFNKYARLTKDRIAEELSILLNDNQSSINYRTKTIWNPNKKHESVPLWEADDEEEDEPEQEDEIPNPSMTHEGALPVGDQFRVVREDQELPPHLTTTSNRTPQQDSVIESLKADHGSVSILPGGENEMIRVLAGADIYSIDRLGNFTAEETGANTNALMGHE